jgi:hypothetical protein
MPQEKQTTAVSQLKKWAEKNVINITGQDGVIYIQVDFFELLAEIEEALKIERQQIEDAYNQGTMDWDMTDEKDYFESTFTQ